MSKKIPLATPTLNGEEILFVHEAFDTNWVAPVGPHITAFEREVADLIGVSHSAALSSATAAIHLSVKAAGVCPGDIVLCQDLTFVAACNPVKYEMGIPVFVDSEPGSWNICPKSLEMALDKYPKAKAVIAVNLYGTPARLDEIAQICRARNVFLIEDAAESLGATLNGKHTASFGRIGILSFNGNKIITTSGGGMLLSEDEEIVKKAVFWSTQAKDPARHYQHTELGYNYRMSNICAGIGRGQLKTLELRLKQKANIYRTYEAAFSNHPWVRMNPIPGGSAANHWLSCITLEKGSPVTPIDILELFDKENIEGRPIWKPMSLQPYYKDCDFVSAHPSPVSADVFARGLCLPSDVKMTPKEQGRVCDLVLSVF